MGKKSWAKRALEYSEHADFFLNNFGGFGLFATIAKGTPVVIALAVALLSYTSGAPLYIWVMCGLASLLMSLTIVYLYQFISDRQRIRRSLLRVDLSDSAPTTTSQANDWRKSFVLIISSSVMTAVFIASYYSYSTSRAQFDQTVMEIAPKGTMRLAGDPNNPSHIFGIDVNLKNTGPLRVTGRRTAYHYQLSSNPLVRKDQELYASTLESSFDDNSKNDSVLLPGASNWTTYENPDVTPDVWRNVLSGKQELYLFIVQKYNVDGRPKTTEMCIYLNKDFPSQHVCEGANRIIADR